jgi:hypothetical protein
MCRVHQPLRQCLGWVLLAEGRLSEAADVYKQVRQLGHHALPSAGSCCLQGDRTGLHLMPNTILSRPSTSAHMLAAAPPPTSIVFVFILAGPAAPPPQRLVAAGAAAGGASSRQP